jgi:endo-1,4-beta-xylanase
MIRVQDARGQPVQGARITLEQLRHDFLFGCNLFLLARCPDAEREQAYRRHFSELFNFATLGFYWATYEPARGRPNYDYTDEVLQWTESQSIVCKGHPLVWDHPAGSPAWLPEDPAEISQLVAGRVTDIVSRFSGRLNLWDVVNEPTHLPEHFNKTRMAAWGAALGPVDYAREPLNLARRANSHAFLLVNDYRTDPPYLHILERLRDKSGSPLMDAVGIQSHMHQGAWPLHKVYSVCDTYARLGLPLHFTETTIVSGSRVGDNWHPTTPDAEDAQAEQAAAFYTALFAHPAVRALTWWDLSDYRAWQGAPAGLLRADMTPKPAYDRLAELIRNQWWTKTQGVSDADGKMAARGFHGRYRLTAERSGAPPSVTELHLQPRMPNRFTVTL